MATIKRFESRIEEYEDVANKPTVYLKAINAAKFFAKALDALQVEFAPDVHDEEANNLYNVMVRDYLLEAAADIEEFIDDDYTTG